MNKTAIKNYATWARKELMDRVTQKAYEYGVSGDDNLPAIDSDAVNGRLLSDKEKIQLNELIYEVKKNGFNHVIEEVAYTWFNRFIALRYMEVNNYLPQRIRIFTNENNEFKPQMLTEAIHLDIEGLDKETISNYIDNNDQEGLYKYLLLAICNDMINYLPEMFTSLTDYRTLLFPDNLLREDSVLSRLITDIDEQDWTDQVQIIGWLYQYYVSDRHNEVNKITKNAVNKEDIPAATQIFTTDWVVRYMVDNSLGRYWIERNPNSELKNKLEYLAIAKDGSLPTVDEKKNPEEIIFIDPCMGSGHILVYAFDVLMEIYRECGYSDNDAVESILKNNLFGIDIDKRAYQLSYFSVMMKARSYSRRILTSDIVLNVIEMKEPIKMPSKDALNLLGEYREKCEYLLDSFKDAKELGSLIEINLTNEELDEIEAKLANIDKMADYGNLMVQSLSYEIVDIMYPLLKQARLLSKKYSVVTTNPPYLNKLSGALKKYVAKCYKDYSSDLFAVFMNRNFSLAEKDGYLGFMTPNVWMFIKTYEKTRNFIIKNKQITTLIQMANGAFFKEATVDICSFVLKNIDKPTRKEAGIYFRLTDFKGDMEYQRVKYLELLKNNSENVYIKQDDDFIKIPGSPIAYWVSDNFINNYNYSSFGEYAEIITGMTIGDNGKFLRLWNEIDYKKIVLNKDDMNLVDICKTNWIPYSKGGPRRNWYGNYYYVVNWLEKDNFNRSKTTLKHLYLKEALTWPFNTSGDFSARFLPKGFLWDVNGSPCFFDNEENEMYGLAILCSKPINYILKVVNPTISVQAINIEQLPFIACDKERTNNINGFALQNVSLSKSDWDSFEASWDFKVHPLIKNKVSTIKEAYELWDKECNDRFNTLKSNEEELNRIFIDIYGLQDELTPEVEDKDVTVRKADLTRDIKSLISYAVGCMFGRYSLDKEGLAYAGGEFDKNNYKTYLPDEDNILPICDEEYFEDDIVSKFIKFIEVVYGKDTLEENLTYIAKVLGGKGSSREAIRSYFLNDFFKDHCNTYQVTGSGKRPIYWLFDSGKNNGFKASMYIHRYTPELIARLRTEYIHPLQSKYRTQIDLLENQINNSSTTSEKVKLTKQLTKIKDQAKELSSYEEKVHHYADMMIPMDLDDGVKSNYTKFEELLGKIK